MHILHRLKRFKVVCNGRRNFSLHHRLCFKCLDSVLNNATDKRNIGIIAHIDAGKTTVTERLLYLSGLTTTIGDVDDGNTITDFMELERERGITIQSAAITSMWRNHRINLIDTPGHVDFTLEVERALRVMDGTVTVLDGSAGVQAQTLTVWRQALKFALPSVFFVNKMDKPAANFQKCVDSVQKRLGHSVVPVVVPIVRDHNFAGVVNVLDRTFLDIIPSADLSTWSAIEKNTKYADICDEHLDNIISHLSDVDEEFEKRLFSDENISAQEIRNALRSATLGRRLSPIACGTALRSTESVKSVLDMIVDFLPGPSERIYNLPKADFCALVFKVGHDERHGQLGYARVYKGSLKSGQGAQNANRNSREAGLRLFTPYSDILHPTEVVEAGDVAVISGLKSTVTGDTLVSGIGATKINEVELRKCVLEGIESPDPVFSCSVEPPSSSAIHEFDRALAELCVEDPSLRIVRDADTSQIILQGMGELHIEVIKERLKREYGLNVFMGPLRVGYREILNESITKASFTEDLFGDNKQKHWCSLRLQLDPTKAMKKFQKVHVEIEDEDESPIIRDDWLDAINEGCRIALYSGPLLGYPVGNLMITLKALSTSGNRVNSALLSASASRCVKEALKAAGTQLIEPIMRLELSVMAGAKGTAGDKCDAVFHELSHRRAAIQSIDESTDGHLTVIHATIPLSETTGIANKMRELTSGLCGLHMEVGEYEKVLPEEQSAIIDRHMHGSI